MQIKAISWSHWQCYQTMIWGSMALGKGQSSIYAPPYWGHNFGSATFAWKRDWCEKWKNTMPSDKVALKIMNVSVCCLGLSSLHSSIWSFSLFWATAKHFCHESSRSVESAWLGGNSLVQILEFLKILKYQMAGRKFVSSNSLISSNARMAGREFVSSNSQILITCTANTDSPFLHGKGRVSHQFQQNLSMHRPAWC